MGGAGYATMVTEEVGRENKTAENFVGQSENQIHDHLMGKIKGVKSKGTR